VTTESSSPPKQEILDSIEEQAEDLSHIHDHITRIIKNIDIGEHWFSGYDEPARKKFDLEPVVKALLYMYAREIGQSELNRRLKGATYLYLRFGLEQPLSQPTISHNERNRFDYRERGLLKDAAECIRDVCADHEIVTKNQYLTKHPPLAVPAA